MTTGNNMKKKVIFIELNEINFDAVSFYIERGEYLLGFEKLIKKGIINTEAEAEYENLEPWVQWPSVHTGKTYDEHKVFRLGDFVNSTDQQFFEQVEKAGFSVGAVSPMNASNQLQNPAYFIPDPWTQTPCDNSFFSKSITDAVVQAVNDNSQAKLTFKTIFNLGLAFIALVKPSRYLSMAKYALGALSKPWRKALFLDMLLYEIHKTLFMRKNPNFSTLFLNAGAHIQHHYFFNSKNIDNKKLQNPNWYIAKKYDPLDEAFNIYDKILGSYLSLKECNFMLATGLSQIPYDRIKYYYKLKKHEVFFDKFDLKYQNIFELMSRDFLIRFKNQTECTKAYKIVESISDNNNKKLFADIQIKENDLFVSFVYDEEIKNQEVLVNNGNKIILKNFVNFVALKNGMHNEKGFIYFEDFRKDSRIRIENIKSEILKNI